jgi:acetate kinase
MPAQAYMYGLPYKFYEQYHVRRYGFHGTSHKYLVETAAGMLNKPMDKLNAITCHLGTTSLSNNHSRSRSSSRSSYYGSSSRSSYHGSSSSRQQ